MSRTRRPRYTRSASIARAPLAAVVVIASAAAAGAACSESAQGGPSTPDAAYTPPDSSAPLDASAPSYTGPDADANVANDCVDTLTSAASFPEDLAKLCAVALEKGAIVPLRSSRAYQLNAPLFSDYAVKVRTVALPPGKSAKWSETGPLDFPIGTVITKSFGFPDDARKSPPTVTWVETRILARAASGWLVAPYIWDAAQKQATLTIEGGTRAITFVGPAGDTVNAKYLIPNSNQCKKCHDLDGAVAPIGPHARNLNRVASFEDGPASQLARWAQLGMLTGAPPEQAWPKLPAWDDAANGTTAERARSWLDGNCAHCHNPRGSARTTGLALGYDESDSYKLGVCKSPVAAGQATGSLHFDIVPGAPDKSILVYRLASTAPGIMMPELGRSVVDVEGLQLIRDWVSKLPGSCDGAADGGTD